MRRLDTLWAVLRPLDAREEGLAAGTGLLLGRVAEQAVPEVTTCLFCSGAAVVDVLDLVDKVAHMACTECSHRWTTDADEAASR